MGGINTRPVDCASYADAAGVEADIDDYLLNGLIPEAEIMIYYSWYWWAMYVWNVNTQSFLMTMDAILNCGVSGGVDSKYGQDWIDGTWTPQRARMQEIFDILDMWWAPWIMILFQLPWPPLSVSSHGPDPSATWSAQSSSCLTTKPLLKTSI